MSVERANLPRGVKITADLVGDLYDSVESQISNRIESEDLKLSRGRFDFGIHLPSIESYMFDSATNTESVLMVPYTFPPTQDEWEDDQTVSELTPTHTLESISVGFDQMRMPTGITDPWDTNGAGQNLSDAASAYTMELELFVRTTRALPATADNYTQATRIYALEIDGTLFASSFTQGQPFEIEGINIPIDPYKTYFWQIRFPNLDQTVSGFPRDLGVPSFTMILRHSTYLVSRDTTGDYVDGVQNIPSNTNGNKSTTTLTLDNPTVGSAITAEVGASGNARVQRNLDIIDDRITRPKRLRAGYNRYSEPPTSEEIEQDSSYFCWAVPMFAQIGDIRASDINLIGLPYGPQGDFSATSWDGILADRRFIPLRFPVTIHGVIAVHNFYSPPCNTTNKPRRVGAGSGQLPWASPTFTSSIGVAAMSGVRGERKAYQQIALANLTATNESSWVIDRVKQDGQPPIYGLGNTGGYDQALYQIPLVHPNTRTGFAYHDNGPPFFVGKSNLYTADRENCGVLPAAFGGGAAGTPNTDGCEQMLEVRWTMSDSASLSPSNTNVVDQTTYVGNGGNWVLIYGKRAVADMG